MIAAVRSGSVEAIRALVADGVSVDARYGSDDQTALMVAAVEGGSQARAVL